MTEGVKRPPAGNAKKYFNRQAVESVRINPWNGRPNAQQREQI